MEVVPNEVRFAAAKLDGFVRNRFRLETSGSTSAGPASIVTIQLPENAIIDLRTLRVHMDVATTSATVSGKTVFSKLGSYYERMPNGDNSLLPGGRGEDTLTELKVYKGVYGPDEYIPFTDAEPFALN